MSNFTFHESTPWTIDFPAPEVHVGPLVYREHDHPTEFCFEIRGGKGEPFAVIRPDRFLVPIPEYVLRRLAETFRSKWPEPLRVDFPADHPSMAYLFSSVARSKTHNAARWINAFRAAPHLLSEWLCVGLQLHPSAFILLSNTAAFLFERPFDHELDDYAPAYQVHRVPLELVANPEARWEELC